MKPYALTASFLMPQVNDYVDLGKLPEADTVAKHLSPTVLSQTYDPNGCLTESVGTFTFGQAAAVIAGGAIGANDDVTCRRGTATRSRPLRRPRRWRLLKSLPESEFSFTTGPNRKINLRILANVV